MGVRILFMLGYIIFQIDAFELSDISDIKKIHPPTSIPSKTDTKKDINLSFSGSGGTYSPLLIPKLCYEAIWYLGKDKRIKNQNSVKRHFSFEWDGNELLTGKILIKSFDGNITLKNSTLEIRNINSDLLSLNGAKQSPGNTFDYFDAPIVSPVPPEVAFGNEDENMSNGGSIFPGKDYYVKMFFNLNREHGTLDQNYEITVKSTIDAGSGKMEYTYSTDSNSSSNSILEPCPSSTQYQPVYGEFNIENINSDNAESRAEKYSLNTRVSGKPFDISVVSYRSEDPDTTLEISDTGVELELLNGEGLGETVSTNTFCSDYDENFILQKHMVQYPKNPESRVNVTDLKVNRAVRNALFRVWYITDSNEHLINSNCYQYSTDTDIDLCFAKTYMRYKEDNPLLLDPNNKCIDKCGKGENRGCYNCLKLNLGHPLCSRDNFSIRPESYRIILSDNNETGNLLSGAIFIGSNEKKEILELSAGYLYRLDINATIFHSDSYASGYNRIFADDGNRSSALLGFRGASTCLDKNSYGVRLFFEDGHLPNHPLPSSPLETPLNALRNHNAGLYSFSIEDKNWTYVDQKGNPDKPFPNISDCIAESSLVPLVKNAKVGCFVNSNDNNRHHNLLIHFNPYRFSLSNVKLYSNPNSENNRTLYINNLKDTLALIHNGSVMAAKIKGKISALGKDGRLLGNFTENCDAADINLSIAIQQEAGFSTVYDKSGRVVKLLYSVHNPEIENQDSIIVSTYENNKSFVFNKSNFTDLQKGEANLSIYYNYGRSYNTAINPIKLNFRKIRAFGKESGSTADANRSYYPEGEKDLNASRIFYYARAKSSKKFYDDVSAEYIYTPIAIVKYCDLSIESCRNLDINTTVSATDEYNWWLAVEHNSSAGEGVVYLQTDPAGAAAVTPKAVINSNGIDSNVTVKDSGLKTRPFTVTVKTAPKSKNESPWLLFNPEANIPSVQLYRVRFVGKLQGWSGSGSTGHIVNPDAGGKKTYRMEW